MNENKWEISFSSEHMKKIPCIVKNLVCNVIANDSHTILKRFLSLPQINQPSVYHLITLFAPKIKTHNKFLFKVVDMILWVDTWLFFAIFHQVVTQKPVLGEVRINKYPHDLSKTAGEDIWTGREREREKKKAIGDGQMDTSSFPG